MPSNNTPPIMTRQISGGQEYEIPHQNLQNKFRKLCYQYSLPSNVIDSVIIHICNYNSGAGEQGSNRQDSFYATLYNILPENNDVKKPTCFARLFCCTKRYDKQRFMEQAKNLVTDHVNNQLNLFKV